MSPEQPSERSDAGMSTVQDVFGFVKRNLTGAQWRMDAASGERGAGERSGSPGPRPALERPGARSALRIAIDWIREDYAVSEDLFLQVASQTAFSLTLRGLFGASRQSSATIRRATLAG